MKMMKLKSKMVERKDPKIPMEVKQFESSNNNMVIIIIITLKEMSDKNMLLRELNYFAHCSNRMSRTT